MTTQEQMMTPFTEAGVERQKKHKFLNTVHTFPRTPETTIEMIGFAPASMKSLGGTEKPCMATLAVDFVPSRASEMSSQLYTKLTSELKMRGRGIIHGSRYLFNPEGGVMTPSLLQNILIELQKIDAIKLADIPEVAKTFGIPAPDWPKKPKPSAPTRPDIQIAPSLDKMLFGK